MERGRRHEYIRARLRTNVDVPMCTTCTLNARYLLVYPHVAFSGFVYKAAPLSPGFTGAGYTDISCCSSTHASFRENKAVGWNWVGYIHHTTAKVVRLLRKQQRNKACPAPSVRSCFRWRRGSSPRLFKNSNGRHPLLKNILKHMYA